MKKIVTNALVFLLGLMLFLHHPTAEAATFNPRPDMPTDPADVEHLLSGESCIGCILKYQNFRGIDLRGVYVSGVLNGSNFEGAQGGVTYEEGPWGRIPRHTEIHGWLQSTNFGNSSFPDSLFTSCYLDDADFSEANLENARFTDSEGQNVTFKNANLKDAELKWSKFKESDFSGANLSGADLRGMYARDSNFSGANLSNADLTSVNLDGANLTNADLTGATGTTNQRLASAILCNTTLPNGMTLTIACQ